MKTKAEKIAECYHHIEMDLGRYENMRYLSDMDVNGAEYLGEGLTDQEYYRDTKKARGMTAIYKLVGLLVPESLVEEAFACVVTAYEAEWDRYLLFKAAGCIQAGTDEYTNYSWRGTGPKPYFEGLIANFMLLHSKRRWRSIDDYSEMGCADG